MVRALLRPGRWDFGLRDLVSPYSWSSMIQATDFSNSGCKGEITELRRNLPGVQIGPKGCGLEHSSCLPPPCMEAKLPTAVLRRGLELRASGPICNVIIAP